jgi:hypothetical protein
MRPWLPQLLLVRRCHLQRRSAAAVVAVTEGCITTVVATATTSITAAACITNIINITSTITTVAVAPSARVSSNVNSSTRPTVPPTRSCSRFKCCRIHLHPPPLSSRPVLPRPAEAMTRWAKCPLIFLLRKAHQLRLSERPYNQYRRGNLAHRPLERTANRVPIHLMPLPLRPAAVIPAVAAGLFP